MHQVTKDPDATLDYSFDWSEWLGADTIATSTILLSSDDLTNDQDTNSPTAATVWLSGGVLGETYNVTNRITTAGGRSDDRSIIVQIVEK